MVSGIEAIQTAFDDVSREPLLMSEVRQMRDRNLKMLIELAKFSGQCTVENNVELQMRADECIASCLSLNNRLNDSLHNGMNRGADIHLRRVAAAIDHVYQIMGLQPVPSQPVMYRHVRVIGINEPVSLPAGKELELQN